MTDKLIQDYENVKKQFSKAILLRPIDFNKEFILETDASNLGTGATLKQRGDDNKVHVVALTSSKIQGAQKFWNIAALELKGIFSGIINNFNEIFFP